MSRQKFETTTLKLHLLQRRSAECVLGAMKFIPRRSRQQIAQKLPDEARVGTQCKGFLLFRELSRV